MGKVMYKGNEFQSSINRVVTGEELPDVTSSDNGKILKVVEGEWNKGDKPFIPTISTTYLNNYENYLENDTIYLVRGLIDRSARLSKDASSSTSEISVSPNGAYVTNHEGWRAFHDGDEYGWTNHYADGYLTYMFSSARVVNEIDATLKWHGIFTDPHLCSINWEYTVNGTDWITPTAPYLVDYTVTSGTTITEKSVQKKMDNTIMLGVRFKNPYIMCGSDAGPTDWVFELHDVAIKGLDAVLNADYNTNASTWYKGRCYGEIRENS